MHVIAPLASWYCPYGQWWQSPAEVRPACFEKRPTAHLLHFDAATLTLLGANVPATQAMQSEALLLPVVSTYRPAPHAMHAVEPALL